MYINQMTGLISTCFTASIGK